MMIMSNRAGLAALMSPIWRLRIAMTKRMSTSTSRPFQIPGVSSGTIDVDSDLSGCGRLRHSACLAGL